MNCTLCDGDGYIRTDVTEETDESEYVTCPRCDGTGCLDSDYVPAGSGPFHTASDFEVKK